MLPLPSKRYIDTLTGLRGVAILMVLMYHLVLDGYLQQQHGIIGGIRALMWTGWTGVDLFFAISGFLITNILLDTRLKPHYFRSFHIHRILRIFPLYYLVLAVIFLARPLFLHHPALAAIYPSNGGFIAYLFFVQNWWMPLFDPGRFLLGHFWTLAVEEQFYLLWPLIVWRTRSRTLFQICIVGAFLCPLIRYLYARHDPTSMFVYMSTAARFDTLLFGCALAIALRYTVGQQIVSKLAPRIAIASIIGLFGVNVVMHDLFLRGLHTQVLGYTLVAILSTCIVFYAWKANGTRSPLDRLLNSRFLQTFGRYSYGIYVFHAPVFILTSHYLRHQPWFGVSVWRSALCGLAVAAFVFCLAALSFELFESFFLARKRNYNPE